MTHILEKNCAESLIRLLSRPPKIQRAGHAERFLITYIFCEALIRVVLRGYENRNATTQSQPKLYSTLRKDVIANGFRHFGIRCSPEDVDALLDTKLEKRGSKSARLLRNGIVHNWSAADENEVRERYPTLSKLMDRIIQAITEATNSQRQSMA